MLIGMRRCRIAVPEIAEDHLGVAQSLRTRYRDLYLDLAGAMNAALAVDYDTDAVLTLDRRDLRAVGPLGPCKAFRVLPDDLPLWCRRGPVVSLFLSVVTLKGLPLQRSPASSRCTHSFKDARWVPCGGPQPGTQGVGIAQRARCRGTKRSLEVMTRSVSGTFDNGGSTRHPTSPPPLSGPGTAAGITSRSSAGG